MAAATLLAYRHGSAPYGVSPVAVAFLRQMNVVCGDDEMALLRRCYATDPTLLAHGILRTLDIPEEGVGGATLSHAWSYLRMAWQADAGVLSDPDHVLASHAASIAGEALHEWVRVHGFPAKAPNNPFAVLERAHQWAESQGVPDA